jgi:hypothetical protein
MNHYDLYEEEPTQWATDNSVYNLIENVCMVYIYICKLICKCLSNIVVRLLVPPGIMGIHIFQIISISHCIIYLVIVVLYYILYRLSNPFPILQSDQIFH